MKAVKVEFDYKFERLRGVFLSKDGRILAAKP